MFTLKTRISANSITEPLDVLHTKHALNRLGYYKPFEETGMHAISDNNLFDSIRMFQKDYGVNSTGEIFPGDRTFLTLKKEARKRPSGSYIWRSVIDSLSTPLDRALNGTTRKWGDAYDPTENIFDRSWALPVNSKVEKEELPPTMYGQRTIPGTKIPDKGVPEQGWPGSTIFDPYRPPVDYNTDPDIVITPDNKHGPNMPIYDQNHWWKKKPHWNS